jgi:hypothetical protein
MLHSISWLTFIAILVLALITYYLYLLVRYYRQEFLSLLSMPIKLGKPKSYQTHLIKNEKSQHSSQSSNFEKPNEETFTIIHELLEDLKNMFLNASKNKMVKEELIQAIGSKLKTYPSLPESDLIDDINNHLIMEIKENCQLDIFPDDLKRIWDQ